MRLNTTLGKLRGFRAVVLKQIIYSITCLYFLINRLFRKFLLERRVDENIYISINSKIRLDGSYFHWSLTIIICVKILQTRFLSLNYHNGLYTPYFPERKITARGLAQHTSYVFLMLPQGFLKFKMQSAGQVMTLPPQRASNDKHM